MGVVRAKGKEKQKAPPFCPSWTKMQMNSWGIFL
jgi:hypothetical protein